MERTGTQGTPADLSTLDLPSVPDLLLTDSSSTTPSPPHQPTKAHINTQTSQPATQRPAPAPKRPLWKRAFSALGGASILFCHLFLLAWLFAVIATDRFLISQFLYWFNPALVLAALAFLLLGWFFKRLGGRRGVGRAPLTLLTVALVVMAGREYGVFRWIAHLPDPVPSTAGGKALRIVHWNMAVFDAAPGVDVGARLAGAGVPDIALVSMQNNPRLWEQIVGAMKRKPDDAITLVNCGPDKVFSRFPVTATGRFAVHFSGENVPDVPAAPPLLRRSLAWLFSTLQLHDRSPVDIEDATIIGLTFDTTASIGRPLHAWFIDMPSNPLASRADLVNRVVARAAQLRADGSLPAPDIIAGDFNIPIGSHSLETFAPGFAAASGAAGLGRLASWPRPRQVLQIDHMLVAPGWWVSDYQTLDPGASEHMAQTALVWPADTSSASGAAK